MPLLALVTLVLTPWHGASLPTATPGAVKYKLAVHGPAGDRVQLNANGLPQGWVASFCTPSLCSPFSYSMQLDPHGTGAIEFQAIRTDDRAPKHARVTIATPGAKPLQIKV